ncbi:hypothetical protein AC35_2615 [Escherichia coli 3-475-03_S3_C2]|nr:hypothetical protein ECOK1357_4741 [Escherichia coli OK1357]KEK87122.1 hypothetical protein AC35_2615 [Escherichia coli 3-475-03_S3_C2]
MRLIKRARWKGEYLPGTGNVKREPVSEKMYRLQKNKNSAGKRLGEREIAG